MSREELKKFATKLLDRVDEMQAAGESNDEISAEVWKALQEAAKWHEGDEIPA